MKPEWRDLKRACSGALNCLHTCVPTEGSYEICSQSTCPIWQKWSKQGPEMFTVEQIKKWIHDYWPNGNFKDMIEDIDDAGWGLAAHARKEQK